MSRTLDCRGLACPQPVLLARRELAHLTAAELEVQVDNASARDNLMRLAQSQGRPARAEEQEGGFLVIIGGGGREENPEAAGEPGGGVVSTARVNDHIRPEVAESAACSSQPAAETRVDAGLAVFMGSDELGRGPDELSRLLGGMFLYTLSEAEPLPGSLILMNSGVRLAVEGSETAAHLERLSRQGTEILVCGTCLDYFQLREQLGAGTVSNMYEIAARLLAAKKVLTLP